MGYGGGRGYRVVPAARYDSVRVRPAELYAQVTACFSSSTPPPVLLGYRRRGESYPVAGTTRYEFTVEGGVLPG